MQRFRNLILLVLAVFSKAVFSTEALSLDTYYGREFFQEWRKPEFRFTLAAPSGNPFEALGFQPVEAGQHDVEQNPAAMSPLRTLLHEILSGGHIRQPNDFDTIVGACPPGRPNCIQHRPLSYRTAREEMFGRVYLEDSGKGYKIRSVYCDRYYSEEDFPNNKPGPGQIPDHTVMNAEHTWPQSRFGNGPKEYQKSDLNILFPVESRVNSTRSNHPFGQVESVVSEPCPGARLGRNSRLGQQLVFEPPANHRGNVARAMFYFAVRYNLTIDPTQEAVLRAWHRADPVDRMEALRHEVVFELQHVRNPFIDYPELINDFSDL